MDESDELWKVPRVARRLDVSDETVRRWIRAGKLRAISLGSLRAGFRIPRSEVERILREGVTQLELPEADRQKKQAA